MRRILENLSAVLLSIVTGLELGHLVHVRERGLGLYCPPKVCGPDELPGLLALVVAGSCYFIYTKIRGE